MNRRTFLGTVAAVPVAAVVPAAAADRFSVDEVAHAFGLRLAAFYGTVHGSAASFRFKDAATGWASGAVIGRLNALPDDSCKTRSDGWWRG